jgi:hypothetical protein
MFGIECSLPSQDSRVAWDRVLLCVLCLGRAVAEPADHARPGRIIAVCDTKKWLSDNEIAEIARGVIG